MVQAFPCRARWNLVLPETRSYQILDLMCPLDLMMMSTIARS